MFVIKNIFGNRESSKDSYKNDPEIGNTHYNEKLQISTHSKQKAEGRFHCCAYVFKGKSF